MKIILINMYDYIAETVIGFLDLWGCTAINLRNLDNLSAILNTSRCPLVVFHFEDFSPVEFQLLRELRAAAPQIPIIATSPYISLKDALEMGQAGATDYILQPFRPELFKKVLQKNVRSGPSGTKGL